MRNFQIIGGGGLLFAAGIVIGFAVEAGRVDQAVSDGRMALAAERMMIAQNAAIETVHSLQEQGMARAHLQGIVYVTGGKMSVQITREN